MESKAWLEVKGEVEVTGMPLGGAEPRLEGSGPTSLQMGV